MPLTAGTRLGLYEIAGPLGAGGMGEVYRARDTKLGRDVAIKVLPETFAQDTARMARFEREAQVLASLNHPNIAAIYGVEQGALVMELVEGEDLRGPIPVETALNYARQIAAGLEAAHEKGITHRDLKPANIKVTPSGTVKLLDFGLAAVATNTGQESSGTMSPTLSLAMTQAGVILGTAAYMSPEQARGKPVDKRADIWAFGVVLYEILVGRLLFGGGETVTDTLASVVKEEPDWKALPAETPAHVRRLLERCLRKDPNKRLRDIGDARLMLDEPEERAAESPAPRRWIPWTVAGVAVMLSCALLALLWLRPKPAETSAVRFLFTFPEGTRESPAVAAPQIVPSPDGRYLAFIANDTKGKNHLWVRALSSISAQRLDKTEGANYPFWSPDGQSIGFFADEKLKRIAVTGGSPQTICDAGSGGGITSGDGGTWSQAGIIVFSAGSRSPLLRVAAAGGPPVPATTLESNSAEYGHSWPQFLPDGRHVLYFARNREQGKNGIYVQELGSSKRVPVLQNALRAVYAPPGYLLFAREGTLFAQRLDPKTFQLQGEALSVAQDVTENVGNGRAAFAVSGSGVLAYRGGGYLNGRQLAWYDREGKRLSSVGEPGDYGSIRLSPNEKYAALLRLGGSKGGDVWIMDLASGVPTRTTFDGNVYLLSTLAWSPNSQRLAVGSNNGGITEIVVASRAISDLSSDSNCARPMDWSADGRSLLCHDSALNKITVLPLIPEPAGGSRKPQTVLDTPFVKFGAHFSPDGRTVAYLSTESGQLEVYVASFPSFAEKRQVSGGGGGYPVWSKDGRELYFYGANNTLMAAEVKTGARIEVGIPRPLFKINLTGYGDQYAATADGKRFLIRESPLGSSEAQVMVVLNWAAELK